MQNNDNKPTADDVANEFSGVRRSAIWGKAPEEKSSDRELVRLSLEQVDPDPNQPRSYFNEKGLEDLRKSIGARGQLTPAFVRPHPSDEGRYMLIAGERRYRVLKDLGQSDILAFVLRVNEQEAREIALIDNLQRADLSPFEEAAGYARLIDEFGYTQEQLAETVGKDQTVISNTLTITKLPENIKKDEFAQQASKSVLLELARVNDAKKLRTLWGDIKKDIKAGLPISVRKVREKRTTSARATRVAEKKIDKVVLAGQHFSKQLSDLTVETLLQSPERQEALRAIKARLDELFALVDVRLPTPEDHSDHETLA